MRESRQPPSFINWSPGDRDVFRALLCLSCLSFVLPSESFLLYPVFFPCYLRSPFVSILFFLCVIFGAFLCLFRLFPVLHGESFGVAPVFFPCYLWNSLVFILPFLCVVSVTLFFLFYSCFIFVLSLFHIYTVFVSLLYGFFFVFMLPFCLYCAVLVWFLWWHEIGLTERVGYKVIIMFKLWEKHLKVPDYQLFCVPLQP